MTIRWEAIAPAVQPLRDHLKGENFSKRPVKAGRAELDRICPGGRRITCRSSMFQEHKLELRSALVFALRERQQPVLAHDDDVYYHVRLAIDVLRDTIRSNNRELELVRKRRLASLSWIVTFLDKLGQAPQVKQDAAD